MTSNPGAVGALILVPIAIAGSVAFVAIKTNHFFQKTGTQCKTFFTWHRKNLVKQRRSELSTSQAYADSWYDLESTNSGEEGDPVQLSLAGDSWSKTEITRPEPLRIVKEHANTITGCSTSNGISTPRRGSIGRSGTNDASPDGPHRSLTVFKRRRSRASILDSNLEWNSYGPLISPGAPYRAAPHKLPHTPDYYNMTTEKSSARSKSIGSFLKSELFQKNSKSDQSNGPYNQVLLNPQNPNGTLNSSELGVYGSLKLADFSPDQHGASKIPLRQQSLRKRIVSKAVDGLGNVRSKSMHFLRSNSSKESLLRRVSLKNLDSSQPTSSESSRGSSRFSFEEDSVLISDSTAYTDTPSLLLKPSFILYPEIAVVPEVDSVDASDETSIWVAVKVTGVLRKTSECARISDMISNLGSSEETSKGINSENIDFGHLHGLDITLAGCKGSILESVIADQIQTNCLRLGQSELTLAKVKLPFCRRGSSHVRESSKELIAELESRLGNATTEYLSIGVSYKHSLFPALKHSTVPIGGISYHATTVRIEAHAILKRHCSQSSWSLRTSRDPNAKNAHNPLPDLINAHYDGEKAARLLTRIIGPIPVGDVQQQDLDNKCYWISSSERTNPMSEKTPKNVTQDPIPISTPKQSLDITQARSHEPDSVTEIVALNHSSDPDPARKIWSEMRKTSSGNGMHGSRANRTLNETNHSNSEMGEGMYEEQARIIEIALRNKRSLGADTLRSMAAPSMSLGMSVGRGWGWSPPWW